jgi:TonB family protein
VSTIRRIPPHLLLLGVLALGTSFAHAAARRAVSKVPPIYPELARRMHVSGTVVMQVTIQPDGSVSDMKVESGHALLATAAQQAVKQWKFEPGPETTNATVDVNFGDR